MMKGGHIFCVFVHQMTDVSVPFIKKKRCKQAFNMFNAQANSTKCVLQPLVIQNGNILYSKCSLFMTGGSVIDNSLFLCKLPDSLVITDIIPNSVLKL